jgi:hypothetical protein
MLKLPRRKKLLLGGIDLRIKKMKVIKTDNYIQKEAKKDKTWIQDAVPKSHEGKFGDWCKDNGFDGVCQSCIDKAIAQGGHAAKMANFAINVSKGKYSHPKKD